MTAPICTHLNKEIAEAWVLLSSPREDLSAKFSPLVPSVNEYPNANFDQIYTLVCHQLIFLGESINRLTVEINRSAYVVSRVGDVTRFARAAAEQKRARLQREKEALQAMDKETRIIETGQHTYKKMNKARAQIAIVNELNDGLFFISTDIVGVIAGYILE